MKQNKGSPPKKPHHQQEQHSLLQSRLTTAEARLKGDPVYVKASINYNETITKDAG